MRSNLLCDDATRMADMGYILAWLLQVHGHWIGLATDADWNTVDNASLIEWSVLWLRESLSTWKINDPCPRRFEDNAARIVCGKSLINSIGGPHCFNRAVLVADRMNTLANLRL